MSRRPPAGLAIAQLIAAIGRRNFADSFLRLAEQAVTHDAAALMLFRTDAPPLVLCDRLNSSERGYLYGDYLSGVYLLSPFFREAQGLKEAAVRRLHAIAPDGFRASEYYRRYFSRIGVADMTGILVPLAGGAILFASLSRNTRSRKFSAGDAAALEGLLPVLSAAAARHAELAGPMQAVTAGVPAAAAKVQAGPRLTAREAEVVNLILEGHSTRSLASRLRISVETVRVHRRHIYEKLGVSSQAELFRWFLASRGA